jgi:phenylalanyl-tRNA synthetase beta chain
VAARFDIALSCAVFELELGVLAGLRREVEEYREVSSQPAVRRDVAVLLDRDCPAGDVLEQIRKTAGPQLVSVELFDQYEGKGIPEGKKSLAFRFVLQRADRTLKEAEISKLTERVRGMLVHRFGGELR